MPRITNWISEESDEIGISIYDQSTGKPSAAIGKQSFPRNWEILELHTAQSPQLNCTALHSLHNSNQSNSKWKHCTKLETIVLHLFSVLAVPVKICRFGRKIVRPRNVVICSRAAWEITSFAPFQPFSLIWGRELQPFGVRWLFSNRDRSWRNVGTSVGNITRVSIKLQTCELLSHCVQPNFYYLHFALFIGDNFNVVLSNQLQQTMCEQ